MTVGRLLAAAISALFLFALVGVEAIILRSAQSHLQQQLESLAQDAATSLGLSLGVLLRGGDPALAETVINPAFDRGHYERIEYLAAGGERIVSRHLPAREGNYPAWFARAFRLHPPTAESFVSAGWQQAGRVRVTVHPRFAYEQLWGTARDTVVLLVLQLVLRSVLRPLKAVERAAQAISARHFVTLRLRPRTRELARVVDAMNSLSAKVSEALDAEARRAERLQIAAYQDPVTGLPNALGFTARFETRYEGEEAGFGGVLALVDLVDLGAINRELGSERCDELLRTLLHEMDGAAVQAGGSAARWGGAVTILALPRLRAGEAREALVALRARIQAMLVEAGLPWHAHVYCGGAEAAGERPSLQSLVRGAHDALNRARETAEGVTVLEAELAADAAPDDGPEMVRAALAERRLRLVGQTAYRMSDHRPLHTEVMARLEGAAGQEMDAARFMPFVVAQALAEQLDRTVIEKVLRAASRGEERISINVSAHSMEVPGFVDWLVQRLAQDRALAARLAFEIPEHGVVRNVVAAADFAEAVGRAGAAFAIDHFGVHRDCLALLQRLHPAYVKFAGAKERRIITDAGAHHFAESLVRTARQLDIPVFAHHVDDEATFQAIASLGFSGYQGNLGGAPTPWPRS